MHERPFSQVTGILLPEVEQLPAVELELDEREIRSAVMGDELPDAVEDLVKARLAEAMEEGRFVRAPE